MNTYPLTNPSRAISVRRILLTGIASLLSAHASYADSFTTEIYTGNADSGVDPGKTYTAIGNVVGGSVTVNGAMFTNNGTDGLAGTGWALTDAGAPFGGGGNHSGLNAGIETIAQLFDAFQYNGNPAHFTLTGLTPGQAYRTTFYNQAWGLGADRTQSVTSNLAGSTASINYNEDALLLSKLNYTYTADAAGSVQLSFNIIGAGSMHFYGATNELLNVWSPNSGNNWGTSANWSTGAASNSAGSDASFLGQGAPTVVNLEAAKTAGHIVFAGANAYTISGGNSLTLQAGGGYASIDTEAGGSHTISSSVVFASDTQKTGGGTLNLTGSLSGSGGVIVNGGTLAFTGAQIIGSLASVAGTTVSMLGSVLTTGGNNQSTTVAGTISGAGGSLVKNGSGTMNLSGANDYSGGTTINGGTLRSGSATATGSGQVVIGALGTWDLGLEARTLPGLVGDGNVTRTGLVTTGADGSTTISSGNTYVQALAFNNGNLTINGVNFTGTGPSGAGYSLTGATAGFNNGPVPGGNGGGPSYNSLLGNFYYGGNPGVLNFTGLTAGKAYEAVVFSNQAWGTRVENATFASGSDSQLLAGTDPGNYGYYSYKFVADGSAASITMSPLVASDTYHWYGATLADLGTLQSVLILGDANNYVFNGNVNGGTSIVKVGSGRQELNGVNTYTGPTAMNGGALQFGSGTLSGAITGIGKLIKSGSGLLTLSSAANTYSGGTDINGGTLKAAAPNATGTGRVNVATSATWDLGTDSHTVAGLNGNGTVTRSGGAIGAPVFFTTNAASGISTTRTYSHLLDFGDNAGATVNGVVFTSAGNVGANWSLTGATNLLPEGAGSPSSPTFSDAPNGTGMNQFFSDFYYNGNPGVLTLSGLTPGVTYEARLYNRFWGGPRVQSITFNEGGPTTNQFVFDQDGSTTPSYISYKFVATAGPLSISTTQFGNNATYHWYGASVEVADLSTLTVGDANNYTFSGTLEGSTNLVKQGTGAQTLSGTLSYTGLTTINDGTLNVNAPIGSGNNIVNANGGTTNFGASQTLAELNIGNGALVTLGGPSASPAEPMLADSAPVPEPGSLAMLAGGLLTFLGRRRRRA